MTINYSSVRMEKNISVTIFYLLCFAVSLISSDTFNSSDDSKIVDIECPVIKTTLGEIAGVRQQTVLGNNSFCSYRGIRYAEAPIGQLRFKAPVPSKAWNGIFNASHYGEACIQPMPDRVFQSDYSENCLFLNVFVPNPSICSSSNDIAVIVYIHGGAFQVGAGDDSMYGPHLILNECVIFVTLNYRLGVFGFLPLALDEYSGNMGLKDQQLALEWINNHISAFGGNPKQITLMGESAGAASVAFQRLNSKSRSLFKQAYVMSSSSLSFYAFRENNNKTDLIVKVAKGQGVNIENTDQLVDYLQTVDAYYIMNRTTDFVFQVENVTGEVPLMPSLELQTARNPFIIENPQILLKNAANIPTIYTYLPLESILFETNTINNPSRISYLNHNFTFTLPFTGIDQSSCRAEIAPIFPDIRRFYFGTRPVDEQILPYIQLTSSVNFAYSIQKEVAIQALSNPKADIRLLRINQKTALNILTDQSNSTAIAALGGATHADDVCSYFWCKIKASVYDEIKPQETLFQKSSVKASKILREILTSFAITGKPVSDTASFYDFPLVGSQPLTNFPFAEMHSMSALVSGNNPDQEEFKFWWDIDQRIEEIKKMPCNQK